MPAFAWEGRTRQGAIKKGVLEAANEAAVMAQLRAQSIVPVNVKAKPKDLLEGISLFKGSVSTRELVMFTRQFATMIDAGLPLVQCLDIQAEQQPNKAFKEILRSIIRQHIVTEFVHGAHRSTRCVIGPDTSDVIGRNRNTRSVVHCNELHEVGE